MKNILIIDDNQDDIELCKRALLKISPCHYQVTSAYSPTQGLSLVASEDVDCVIIDFHFPSMSGIELLAKIKGLKPYLPVVVLTGQSDERVVVKLLKNGAQDYLNKKQITAENLKHILQDAITATEKASQALSQAACDVLMIEDSPDDVELYERLLGQTQRKYQFVNQSNGDNIAASLAQYPPDCILLDYSLPGKNGLEVLKEIVNYSAFIPVIMLTGQGNESVAVQAIKNGAENYLVKSHLNSYQLDQAIQDAINKKALQRKLAENEAIIKDKDIEIESSRNFQNLIIEAMPEFLFVKNKRFELVKCNSAFANLYPEDMRDSMLGTTTVETYPEEEAEKFLAMDKLAFKEGYSETYETITFPSGELRTLFTTKTLFEDASGEQFILGIARDVTEKEATVQQLLKSNQDLEQFAYIASHDLRSPLNAILKLVNWIKEDNEDNFDDSTMENFRLIQGRATRMSLLLDDLLSYSRLNKQYQGPEHVCLTAMRENVFELVDGPPNLTINFPEQTLFMPKIPLQIVLVNLVSNAIKHNDKEAVNVTLNVELKTAGYQLTLTDNGPGINFQYADRIFQMFQTLKPRDDVEGSGMGLAMSKKIVEFYGGTIVLLDGNEGATFQIFWPKKSPIQIGEYK